MFKKGHKLAKGGPRENSGRKPDFFKRKCADLVSSPKWFAYCKSVLDGEEVVPQIYEGAIINRAATPIERMHMFEKLSAYGFGKPSDTVKLEGNSNEPLEIIIREHGKS